MENGGEESRRGAARAARVFCRTIKSNRKRRGRRRTAVGFRPVVTGQLFSPAWRRYRTFSKHRVLPPHPLYLYTVINNSNRRYLAIFRDTKIRSKFLFPGFESRRRLSMMAENKNIWIRNIRERYTVE